MKWPFSSLLGITVGSFAQLGYLQVSKPKYLPHIYPFRPSRSSDSKNTPFFHIPQLSEGMQHKPDRGNVVTYLCGVGIEESPSAYHPTSATPLSFPFVRSKATPSRGSQLNKTPHRIMGGNLSYISPTRTSPSPFPTPYRKLPSLSTPCPPLFSSIPACPHVLMHFLQIKLLSTLSWYNVHLAVPSFV